MVLEWLCRKHFTNAEVAAALGVPTSTYDRRKDDEDFPSYERLERAAENLGLSARALQVAFGYLDLNETLLDEEGLRQYVEQGGGLTPSFPTRGGTMGTITHVNPRSDAQRRRRRVDAPPGP